MLRVAQPKLADLLIPEYLGFPLIFHSLVSRSYKKHPVRNVYMDEYIFYCGHVLRVDVRLITSCHVQIGFDSRVRYQIKQGRSYLTS